MGRSNESSPAEAGRPGRSRRDFLKTAALVGGSAALAGGVPGLFKDAPEGKAADLAPRGDYALARPDRILYSVCQQCNTQCGIKVKIQNGVAAKIDGNPLSPWNLTPHLSYKSSPFQTAAVDGVLCPKGQAGIQSAYDPYRIRKVLKRAGRRGEGKWVSISFEQAIREIVDGGLLFKNVPGEENRNVEGLRAIRALTDAQLAKEMSADVAKIWKKEMTVAEFQAKHKNRLDLLIDPDHPDLGPKNNQFVFMWGRLKGGRGDLVSRFAKDSFGTVNAHGHTTVCQGSLYFTGKAMSEQYLLDEKELKYKWTGGKKFYWQADTENSEFIIFVGASPFEGNYGPTNRAGRITNGLEHGRLKIAVVDPRFSKAAAKAWKWIPIKPGTEGAMALAMIRWVIENRRYDEKYLKNANKAAAKADGEPNWCNASWLVKIEKDGSPGAFLRGSEIGLPKIKKIWTDKESGTEKSCELDPFVVLSGGKAVAFDAYDEKNPVEGDLLVDTEIRGTKVKSGLQVLWEQASGKSVEEWAEISGIKASDIEALAREFTSHGKKAAADVHRGASQHTNGFYNVFAWFTLNLLIGNYDWRGGMCQASTFDAGGGRTFSGKLPDGSEGKWAQPYPIGKLTSGKTIPFGIDLIRANARYEDTTIFEGYPARRPWFPLSSDIYQEVVPSAGDAYPYPIKALFLYMGTPVYSLPAGHTNIEILSDVKKVPLFIASDIVVGETSMYADYVFPDLSYLERWEMAGSHPSMPWKVQPVRQPVIAPLTETVKVFGEEMPLSLEATLLAIAERMNLPGFGPGGFGEGKDFKRPEDLYVRMVANLAAGDKPGQEVPDADEKEMKLFLDARRHLPRNVFDPARWEKIAGAWWRKVVYVLNRGGRFDDFPSGYEGALLKNRYGTLINLYQEKTARTKNSMTGKNYSGIATYIPAPSDALGRPIRDEKDGYDLHLITYREIAQTKSRTVADYWLLALLPENSILVNARDAQRLGFKDGSRAIIVSATNPEGVWDLKNGKRIPMIGRVKVLQGIRPGVIAFGLGFGHWAYGAQDIVIDGKIIPGDPRRNKGIHANAAFRVDPHIKNTCLSDLTGGSAVFYDTKVKLLKA
ncbi:MAG TPA: molybdopterin-dependent oxidoreductase [candidate division Zixibacteria bacterium]|nr:molybdopterin-dependent oxidoreductase [candidate division Zixibacteria bacterium]